MNQSDFKSRVTIFLIRISFFLLITQSLFRIFVGIEVSTLDATFVFEILFIVIGLLNFQPRSSTRLLLIFMIISAIFLITVGSYILYNTSFYESLRATKWLFYLIILAGARKNGLIPTSLVYSLNKILILTFLMGYLLQSVTVGIGTRPFMFTENNYEVALLVGLFLVAYISNLDFTIDFKPRWLLALALVVAMSGSLSGVSAFALLVLYIVRESKVLSAKSLFWKVAPFVLIAISGLFVLSFRKVSIFQSDRAHFFSLFLDEVGERNIFQTIFGPFGISEIKNDTCSALIFYVPQLSETVDGSCYSVVFHSFVMRSIIDFGITGFLLSLSILYYVLRGELPRYIVFMFIGLATINGISVSGVNNVYVELPMLIALLIKTPNKTLAEYPPSTGGKELEQ